VEIKNEIREFVASQYLPDVTADTITDSMPLITSGIIDSLGMLGLVDFIESRFAIEFLPREIDVHALDSIQRIETLIQNKLDCELDQTRSHLVSTKVAIMQRDASFAIGEPDVILTAQNLQAAYGVAVQIVPFSTSEGEKLKTCIPQIHVL